MWSTDAFGQISLGGSRDLLSATSPPDPKVLLNIAKFYWASWTFGADPDIESFYTHCELHNQLKYVSVDGKVKGAQF